MTQRPMPTTAHDRPATTTSQRTKVTAHKRSRLPTNNNERSTMAHKRRPAPTSQHRGPRADVSKLTSPPHSFL
ncbi:hypothetical protein K443DRAFT_181908 [Laccaria amethystina LaAM-08-1]|uniref:Uncharacterized protein n=1 Tax=Laccaria amethystina LaAM-08-1 TaxID=1095629 RepID=A0A0C9WW17_9AGAR|nr:hypothetical protein K443DRAFT_181908 [Laccaria amethystina LaAM-08-1]